MISNLDVFIGGDQPSTCSKCGSRVDIVLDMSHTINNTQVCKCPGCGFEFMEHKR